MNRCGKDFTWNIGGFMFLGEQHWKAHLSSCGHSNGNAGGLYGEYLVNLFIRIDRSDFLADFYKERYIDILIEK